MIVLRSLPVLALAALLAVPLPASAAGGEAIAASTRTTASQFGQHVRGKYFHFHSDIPPQRLAMYARLSDLFVELVDRDFFRVRTRFPIQAFVLGNKAEFQSFLRTTFNVAMPSEYGMYLPAAGVFVTYDGSGLGTFTHEIMHALVEESLPARPDWAMEGIPAFFEKFYGYVQDGRLQVQWGYQNPWRIDKLGPELTRLSLSQIINGSQDTSEKRLITVFLHQQGKLKRFLQLVQTDAHHGYGSHLEAALDKPLEQVELDWQRYLADVEQNRARIMRLPTSKIFDTPGQFREFARVYDL